MATLVSSSRRRTRWSVVLSVLGVGWLVATSVTAFGMYMVACHNSASAVSYGTSVDVRGGTSQASLRSGAWSGCTGRWTLGQGHLVLVVGSLLNMVLLVTMICLLLHERLSHKIIKDNPPDYESLIKAETPPPSFDEVHFYQHYTNTSTTTTIPTTTTNTIPTTTTNTIPNTTTPITTCTPPYQPHYTPDTYTPHQPDHTSNTTLTSHRSDYTNEFFTANCISHSTIHKPGSIQDLAPIHVPCV